MTYTCYEPQFIGQCTSCVYPFCDTFTFEYDRCKPPKKEAPCILALSDGKHAFLLQKLSDRKVSFIVMFAELVSNLFIYYSGPTHGWNMYQGNPVTFYNSKTIKYGTFKTF